MSILGLIFLFIAGLTMGGLGAGGSVLSVPVLAYLFDFSGSHAIAISLLVVAINGTLGTLVYTIKGQVKFSLGAMFGIFSMVGAYTGGRMAQFIPPGVLLLMFACIALVAAAKMLNPSDRANNNICDAESLKSLRTPAGLIQITAIGLAVGVLTGLVGAGGGFIIVPILISLGRLCMRHAIGTSLFVISLNAWAGYLGHSAPMPVPLSEISIIVGVAVLGTLGGTVLSDRIKTEHLRKYFGYLILVIAIWIFAKEMFAI